MKDKKMGGKPSTDISPGRNVSTAPMSAMSKSDRENPPVKKIDNRYPQTRKSGSKI